MTDNPLPFGSTAVMARRAPTEAGDLDYFPTPPWATRAVLPFLRGLDPRIGGARVWEPACGEGHMAYVLAEAFARVEATDVFDYSGGAAGFIPGAAPGWSGVQDVRDPRPPRATPVDWVVTNPPFALALEFAEVALATARRGVALLVRTAWLEGGGRYERLFSKRRPKLVLQYAERVPMTKGRWDPNASTATAYCWVIWQTDRHVDRTEFDWIAPGQRQRLSRREDLVHFAAEAATPLLDGGGR